LGSDVVDAALVLAVILTGERPFDGRHAPLPHLAGSLVGSRPLRSPVSRTVSTSFSLSSMETYAGWAARSPPGMVGLAPSTRFPHPRSCCCAPSLGAFNVAVIEVEPGVASSAFPRVPSDLMVVATAALNDGVRSSGPGPRIGPLAGQSGVRFSAAKNAASRAAPRPRSAPRAAWVLRFVDLEEQIALRHPLPGWKVDLVRGILHAGAEVRRFLRPRAHREGPGNARLPALDGGRRDSGGEAARTRSRVVPCTTGQGVNGPRAQCFRWSAGTGAQVLVWRRALGRVLRKCSHVRSWLFTLLPSCGGRRLVAGPGVSPQVPGRRPSRPSTSTQFVRILLHRLAFSVLSTTLSLSSALTHPPNP